MLLSDQCTYSIKAAIFQGSTRECFKDRKEFTGSVLKQIDDALAYLHVYNKVPSTFEGAYRVDHPDYPDVALREAVVNAAIHRDYSIEGPTLVSLYENRLEIMSLGGIMPGVTREIMLAGVSVPRNEKLAAAFHRLKLIEAYGTGIPRIFETYGRYGVRPEIPITDNAFLIRLPNLNAADAWHGHATGVREKPGVIYGADTTTLKPVRRLGKKEKRILENFAGKRFTKQDAAAFLDMSESGAYKLLARMAERGMLTCKRKGREMAYRLAPSL
jgi:ATP-dependent DNA helicase RecG